MSSREGIEIDFCPQCRGVWLDRGELDKIIDRASTSLTPTGGGAPPREERYDDRRQDERGYDERRDYDDDHGHGHGRRRKKKRSFLEDIFEFGGD
ncbi:MAG: zf-TFIIB domain-containing protein [Acidimicrobiales bacterium]